MTVVTSTDRRVRRTRRALLDALSALMAQKGYDAVTVADIIDRADVGRSTFYSHYTDKADLLEDGLADLRSLLRPPVGSARPRHPLDFSLPMFRHAHQQRRLARALAHRSSAGPLLSRIEELLVETVGEPLAAHASGPVPVEAAARFVTGAFLGLLAWWLDQDEPCSAEEIDQVFRALVAPGLRAATGPASA
ncbi:TetR/AcrR family transcriptional regulator [Streptomyces sp. NPDC054833]